MAMHQLYTEQVSEEVGGWVHWYWVVIDGSTGDEVFRDKAEYKADDWIADHEDEYEEAARERHAELMECGGEPDAAYDLAR